MASSSYEGGLREVAPGVYAYLQPHGGWGLSNAGLITDSGVSLLVDTLYDRARTERMLEAMRREVPAAERIDIVVNTHANGDHCWGNEVVSSARRIASEACAREMQRLLPNKLALLMRVARFVTSLGGFGARCGTLLGAVGLSRAKALMDAGPYVAEAFGRFQFQWAARSA